VYHFIINAKASSGKGIKYWWIIKRELDNRNINYRAYFTKHSGHATNIAEKICKSNYGTKKIVIVGGDGTVNEVINGLHNYNEIILGYIPSGSSNDLARSLKIPKDPVEALENILKPRKFQYLDHGMMELMNNNMAPRKFACSSGIGYDANVCYEVQKSTLKKQLNRIGTGKLVYFLIAIKQALGIDFMDAEVIIDGEQRYFYKKVLLLSGMIHKYEGGGLPMAPSANPSDGKLNVVIVHGLSRLKILAFLPTIIFGKHIHVKGVETFICSSAEIKATKDMATHTDGEVPAICSHIKLSNVPHQIRMIT